MKNQYFGDINDYRKYGLLRILSGKGTTRTGVCWMLTLDDGRTDGRFVQYLEDPEKWRKYDPDLFDTLKRSLKTHPGRNVREAETANIIPSAEYFTDVLTDNRDERRVYFDEMVDRFTDVDMIFFDPDNGIEVKSVPYERKDSSKYVYWDELSRTLKAGHSVLVYQHFSRVKRDLFIQRIRWEIQSRLNPAGIFAFRTSNVVFFLVSPGKLLLRYHQAIGQVDQTWDSQIWVC